MGDNPSGTGNMFPSKLVAVDTNDSPQKWWNVDTKLLRAASRLAFEKSFL